MEVFSSASFGNFIILYIAAIFGTKNSLYVSILLYVLGSFLFIIGDGYFTLILGALILGLNDQLITILLKIVMSEFYGADFTFYLPICYAGFAFCALCWPSIVALIVNPDNVVPSVSYIEDNILVYYFDQNIISNFQYFMIIQMFLHLILMGFLTYFFEKKPMKKSRVSVFLKALSIQKNEASTNLLYQKIKTETIIHNLSRASILRLKNPSQIIDKSLKVQTNFEFQLKDSKSYLAKKSSIENNSVLKNSTTLKQNPSQLRNGLDQPLLEMSNFGQPENLFDQQNEKKSEKPSFLVETNSQISKRSKSIDEKSAMIVEFHEDQKKKQLSVWPKLFESNFIFIFCVCVVRTTTNAYYWSDFKIMGLFYFNNDNLINVLCSIVYLANILMNFTFGYIYQYIGARNCFIYTFVLYIFINVGYGLFPTNLSMFVIYSTIHRVR